MKFYSASASKATNPASILELPALLLTHYYPVTMLLALTAGFAIQTGFTDFIHVFSEFLDEVEAQELRF